MAVYKLSFTSPKDGTSLLQLEDAKQGSFNGCCFQILSLSFQAQLYQPNHLVAILSVTKGTNEIPSSVELSALSNTFASSIVSFSLFGLKEFSDHRVFHFSSHSSYNEACNAVSDCTIHLDIRSRDFALSRDAFSKTYVGSKLGTHIISDALMSNQPLGRFAVSFLKASLQHTAFGSNDEARHPYLVQYNESFYSFITRVANRSGEPLFSNDKGQLVLGVLDGNVSIDKTKPYDRAVAINVNNVKSISFPASRYAPKPLASSFHYNYNAASFNPPVATSLPDVEQCSNNEFDEKIVQYSYAFPYGPATTNTFLSAMLNTFFNNQFTGGVIYIWDLVQLFLFEVLPKTFATVAAAARNSVITNNKDNYDKRNSIGPHYSKDEQEFLIPKPNGKDDNKADSNNNDYINCSSPFSSFALKIDDTFLSNIRTKALASAHSIIRLSLKGTFDEKICLGSLASYDNKNYLVIRILFNSSPNQSLTIDLLPADANGKFCPPLYPCASRPPASPQPAFVANNSDPSRTSNLGRIRIRYPWQPDDDVASPWIRISNIFASKTGSSAFIPNVGDEIMVDYEFGNIERPFVAGTLFNASHNQPPFDRCIYSDYGQYIAFRSTPPFHTSSIFSSLVPGYNLVSRFIPSSVNKLASPTKNPTYNQLSGKLEMSDKFGFWNITGDTSKRLVSFSSIYGDISISAFSGITISAPRGDVNFTAKNITFQAANNLRITSGLGRKSANEYKKRKSEFYNGFLDTLGMKLLVEPFVKMVAKATDLGFIRSFWEVIVAPQEGTLFLHSDAFMAFQAGPGQILQLKDPASVELVSQDALSSLLYYVIHYVNSQIDNCSKRFHKARTKVSAFRNMMQQKMNYPIVEKKNFYQIKENDALNDFYQHTEDQDFDADINAHFYEVRNSCLSFIKAYNGLFNEMGTPAGMNVKLWNIISNLVAELSTKFNIVDFSENTIKQSFETAFSPENRKWARRKACKNVYEKFSSISGGLILSLQHLDGDNPNDELNAPDDVVLNDDPSWNAFVDHIVFNLHPSSSPSSLEAFWDFVGSLFKSSYLKPFNSAYPVLDTSNAEIFLSKAHSSNGQILFSDRPDSTSFFSAGELQTTSIDFKKLLKSI